ncbi:MAG: 3-dehydroquinate synthase [Kiritimatiellae bacterium]|nr:3-dehydroquinate synthase [Kiritimatiellia bacterium]
MMELPDIEVDFSKFPKVKTVALVTDSNVDRLYGDAAVRRIETSGLRVERIVFPAGERSKTLETYAELVRGFAALGMTRTDIAVALGGGVVGDLTGFAAATYMRGIDYVQVPTTLLAMVDSSIGGKTGVDIPEGKNLVGAFHLPSQIVRNVGFLATLPEREMKNGFAELIKTAILFDPELFAALSPRPSLDALAPLVERCARWKEKVVAADFREGGRRKLLNLGHTFGHAIESASSFRLSHGEAVAVGMRIVGRNVPEIGAILDEYGFPQVDDVFSEPLNLTQDDLRGYLANDKKRSGETITLVVPKRIGECELKDIPMSELDAWLK